MRVLGALFGSLLAMTTTGQARSQPLVPAEAWEAYRAGFLDPSGRIVDTANGGISHSEGQGYGLLLAVLADDAANFERIWTFTRTELLVRDDGLAAWRWTPGSQPAVTDLNNASDGDILITYALARAGTAWNRPDLTEAARTLAEAIGSLLLFEHEGRTLLRPAVLGYERDERPDGPVVNLSYWVFEALPVLRELAPEHDWSGLDRGGRELLAATLDGGGMPPEWLSVARRPQPAAGFPAEFGYNALRLPLYLVRAGERDDSLLRPLAQRMVDADGAVRIVEARTGATVESLPDPNYRIIPAAVACVLDGTPVPPELRGFGATLYYPSSLHLLGMAYLTENHPECLR